MFDGLGSVGSRVFIAGLIVGAIYGLLILVVVQMRRRFAAGPTRGAANGRPKPTARRGSWPTRD